MRMCIIQKHTSEPMFVMVTNFPHESLSETLTLPVEELSTEDFEHSSDSLNDRFFPRRCADPVVLVSDDRIFNLRKSYVIVIRSDQNLSLLKLF